MPSLGEGKEQLEISYIAIRNGTVSLGNSLALANKAKYAVIMFHI